MINPWDRQVDDRMMIIETVLNGPPEKNKHKLHGGGHGGLHGSSSLPNFFESRKDRLLRDTRVKGTWNALLQGMRTPTSSRPGTGQAMSKGEVAAPPTPPAIMRYACHPPTMSDPCRYASSIYRPLTTPDADRLRAQRDGGATETPQYHGGLSRYASHPATKSDACRFAGNIYRPLPGIQTIQDGRAVSLEPKFIPDQRH